jgi:uncharacterized protein involved in type VI secretion and phage assembly
MSLPPAPYDPSLQGRAPSGLGGHMYGVYPSIVVAINDPDGQGRVRIQLPWILDDEGGVYEVWARYAVLMAGHNRGTWFIPDVGDEVLVSFAFGDPNHPVVLGAMWNGTDDPPERMDSAERNNKKVIRSRNGVKITMDDENGQESIVIETPGGQSVTLKDGPGTIEARDSGGNNVKLSPSGIDVTTPAKLTVSASTVEVNAGMVTVNAGMSRFSGVVQADTVITNSVVSASYTPGAGNIW